MIRVNENETFPITVSLIDEVLAIPATGKTVYYDVRELPGDLPLSPALSGTLPESPVEPGIYKTLASIDEAGTYVVYATCSGFIPNTENIIVSHDYSRHYNTSVEDVVRTSGSPSASQTARNVGLGKTDYVITRIKPELASDWSDPSTVSGIVYAHYRELDDDVPFLMGDSGV